MLFLQHVFIFFIKKKEKKLKYDLTKNNNNNKLNFSQFYMYNLLHTLELLIKNVKENQKKANKIWSFSL